MERWQQIESLFHEALRRHAGERDAWLRDACAGDAELHREVASLMANHHESGGEYPGVAIYKGTGSIDDAANFFCKAP